MKLLRTRDNPEYKYTLAFLGALPALAAPGLEPSSPRTLHPLQHPQRQPPPRPTLPIPTPSRTYPERQQPDHRHQLEPPTSHARPIAGYGPEESSTVFELTYNYGKDSYEKGNAYAQVAISTKVRVARG